MTKLIKVELNKLSAHPANPRILQREDVISSIAAQLSKHGFAQLHAIHARPVNGGFEIISGHHRVEAARRAQLQEIPAWVENLDEEAAYMQLVLSNAQSELSPLERGLHALGYVEGRGSKGGRGKKGGLSEYAREVGSAKQSLHDLVCAAEVFKLSAQADGLIDKAKHLTVIHRAEDVLWPILVKTLIDQAWTVEDVQYWVGKIAEFKIPEVWQKLFLPLPKVVEHFLKTREFSSATVRRLIAEAERIEAMLAEGGGDIVQWHDWLRSNIGGASWDLRSVIERGRELENKLIESKKILEWLAGDWREHIGALNNGSVAALITDPPYGIGYQSDYRLDRRKERKHQPIQSDQNAEGAADELAAALSAFGPKLKTDAAIFVFCQWQNECLTRSVIDQSGFQIRNSLIWVKHTTGMGDPKTTFAPKHERIIFAVKGSPVLFKRLPDVLEAQRPNSKRHPTEKPIELLRQLIAETTVTGDLVVDPFGGVASTLEAATGLDRGAWGCEINKKYHLAGCERLGL